MDNWVHNSLDHGSTLPEVVVVGMIFVMQMAWTLVSYIVMTGGWSIVHKAVMIQVNQICIFQNDSLLDIYIAFIQVTR